MSTRKRPEKTVAPLARAIGADAAWTGALLERLGVKVRANGAFDDDHLRRVLDAWAPKRGGAGKVDVVARETMGADQEQCRQFLIRELQGYGMKLLHREEARGARMTFELPNGKNIWVLTFVALKAKSNPGQVGFMATPKQPDKSAEQWKFTAEPGRLGDAYEWYCFIARPFGKIYALSCSDMHEVWRRRGNTSSLGRMGLTFSQGVDTLLLSNRIDEMLGVADAQRR